MTLSNVNGLVFDVFGTVVDWRSGVIRAGNTLNASRGMSVDWGRIADAWREEYQPALDRVRRGDRPWCNLDELHRETLITILDRSGIDGVNERDIDYLTDAWHRLDPWPDVIPGLLRLRQKYVIAPLSNGHVRLLTNMAKRAGIPWDVILSAELAGRYKPDEAVYRTAAELLDLEPQHVMMVAAHEGDLDASRQAGFHTAYVHRPMEWGESPAGELTKPEVNEYDVIAEDLIDLANQLDVRERVQ